MYCEWATSPRLEVFSLHEAGETRRHTRYGYLQKRERARSEMEGIDTRLRSIASMDGIPCIPCMDGEQFAARLAGQFGQFLAVPNNHGPWLVSQINRRCRE